jgi:tRNA (mo5U34)-methyltransferase
VLYHLRHPLLALDLLRQCVVSDKLVVQSMLRGGSIIARLAQNYPFDETAVFNQTGFPKMYFVEHKYSNDETNWWIPNNACLEAMLRSAGFAILEHPETEVYLCTPLNSAVHPVPRIFSTTDDSKSVAPHLGGWEATA